MGSLYWRGSVLWAKYYLNGRPIRESTGKSKQKEAEAWLKEREGAVASGQPVLPRADKIRYDEVREDLERHYETTGSRGLDEAGWRFDHLDKFFRGCKLVGITGDVIARYISRRQGEGAANGTINRELGVLMKMLNLAYENGKLLRLPVVHKPKEAAPRQGFFEVKHFEAVRRRLPEDLQVAASIAYTFGWRTQSEVMTLDRRHLDIEAGTIRSIPALRRTRRVESST